MKRFKNRNIINAAQSAIDGLHVLTKEPAFRRELFIISWSILSYFIYNINDAIILSVITILIICFEAVNTAIENMCDYINSEYNEKIKIIKDLSSVPIFILVLMFVIFNIYLLIQ